MHSNGKLEVSPSVAKINIRFNSIAPQKFPVKRLMKTIDQNNPIISGLFQIAAQIETPVIPPGKKSAPVVTESEFAALRGEITKSMATDIAKSKSKMTVAEACGWSFPFPIRK